MAEGKMLVPERNPSNVEDFQGFWKSSISSLVIQIESYNVMFFDRRPNFDRDKWTRLLQIAKDERNQLLLHFCRRNHVLNRGQTSHPEDALYRRSEEDSIFWVSNQATIRWNRLHVNRESMLQTFFEEFLGLPQEDSVGWIETGNTELCPYASHWKNVAMQFPNPWVVPSQFKKGDKIIVTEDFPTDDIHKRFLAEGNELTVASVDFAGSIGVSQPGWLTTHWIRRKQFDKLELLTQGLDGFSDGGGVKGRRDRLFSQESMISLLSDDEGGADQNPLNSPAQQYTASQIFNWEDLENDQHVRPALTPCFADLPDEVNPWKVGQHCEIFSKSLNAWKLGKVTALDGDRCYVEYEDLYKWIEYDHPNIRKMRESFDGVTLLMLQGKWEMFRNSSKGWNKEGMIQVESEVCLLNDEPEPFSYIEGHYYWNSLTIKKSKDSDDLLFAQPNGRVCIKWQKIQKPKLTVETLQGDWYIFGEKYQPGDWLIMGVVTVQGTNCFLDNGNQVKLTKTHGENQPFYFMDMPIALQAKDVLLLSHPVEDFNLIWQRAEATADSAAEDEFPDVPRGIPTSSSHHRPPGAGGPGHHRTQSNSIPLQTKKMKSRESGRSDQRLLISA